MFLQFFLALNVAAAASAAVLPSDGHHEHEHVTRQRVPGQWWHDDEHPVHSLFRRASDDGTDYPDVGSPGMFSLCYLSRAVNSSRHA